MKKKQWVVYPLLVALFPVLSLYSHNTSEVAPAQLIWPAVAVVSAIIVVWAVLWGLVRNLHKAALLTSVGVLLFFAFSDVQQTVGNRLMPNHPGRLALALLAGIFLVVAYCVLHTRRDIAVATQVMNWVGLCLVLVPVLFAAPTVMRPSRATLPPLDWQVKQPQHPVKPDIYYIIVDAHGRQDILKDFYALDNSAFLSWLKERGFQVPAQSHSNYMLTKLSLPSSRNFMYMDRAADYAGAGRNPRLLLNSWVHHSRLERFLRSQGYRVVCFDSGWPCTEWRDADEYLAPESGVRGRRSPFAGLLLEQTILPKAGNKLREKGISFDWLGPDQYEAHRQRVRLALDKLPGVAAEAGPKFVMAHIFCPHPPFVFTATGAPHQPDRPYSRIDGCSWIAAEEPAGLDKYRRQYAGQVQFLDKRLQQTLAGILTASKRPCVIVVQGDHGPRSHMYWGDQNRTNMREAFGILNAVYLPGPDAPRLNDDLTPVNTFRIILKHYFGVQLEPLPNRSYFSTGQFNCTFVDVTNRLDEPIPADCLAPGTVTSTRR